MRVTIGIVGFLGASMTAALAQPQAQRRASLLPPQAADPSEPPRVARGAADELPPFPASTPVVRKPAWLDGTDPGVRQAGGTGSDPRQVRPLTPPPGAPRDEPSVVAKGIDKFRSAFGPGGAPNTPPTPPAREAANAGTAFRGTAANGQPVYAGPPAYRWYGWGSVTPGANPYAPTGHYPRASANWYSITGATPGAFPVPVTDTTHLPAGTEPPVYVAQPAPRTPPATTFAPPPVQHRHPVSAAPTFPPFPPAPAPLPTTTQEPPRFPTTSTEMRPAPTPAFTPPPVAAPTPVLPVVPVLPPVAVPTLTAPPAPAPVALTPAEPVTAPLPVIAPPPAPTPPNPPAVPVRPVTDSEPVVGPRAAAVGSLTITPIAPTIPPPPVPAAPAPDAAALVPGVQPAPAKGHTPAPLPAALTEEQPRWQPNTTPPARNEWTPSRPGQPPADGNWRQPGATDTARTPAVARGQMADDQPDPVVALIKKLCEGRATDVDVRRTGTNKLTVCFECRAAADAQKLVKDISARPELAAYQIDFCVLVK